MPKGHDNTSLILDAARTLFLEQSLGAATMEAVAAAAGVSKTTVYAHFRSKDELFVAVVERESEHQMLVLNSSAGTDAGTDAAAVLAGFANEAAALLLAPSTIALHRIVSSEAVRAPAVGRLFYANGPQRLIDGLATYLEQAMASGQLRHAPSHLAAVQFLAVIVGDLQLRALHGLPPASPSERAAVASSGAQVFLAAYAVPHRRASRGAGG